MSESDRDDDDVWTDQWLAAVAEFGGTLAELHRTNPWPDLPLLPRAINTLVTELWDHGLGQSEIRQAFETALTDLPRYTAGEDRRP